ncbi:FAD/NAD-P-binding domain-containing protein [Cytidiella melzeri]|nr:FAD/NAD-P-binding domain-containing protein [Cytidiella melzeri]
MYLLASLVLGAGVSITYASHDQQVPVFFNNPTHSDAAGFKHDPAKWTVFNSSIERVAVIGAGPAGLQAAAALIEHNFTVRLFDRAPGPGGNWLYSEEIPVRESYPDESIDAERWVPDSLPATIFYKEGDDNLSLDERWREHWQPRSVWNSLVTNSPTVITGLKDVPYPPDQPWVVDTHTISAHVRAYASIKKLNANDNSSVHQYSTRVEDMQKNGSSWTLTLRHMKRLEEPDRLKVTYRTEDFDAVVVATGPENFASPHVPEIDGLLQWSKARSSDAPSGYSVYHSRVYRRPEQYAGKTVLVVGVSASASEISRDLAPYAKKLYASHKAYDWDKLHWFQRRCFRRFPPENEFIPQIEKFEPLETLSDGIRNGYIKLMNGTILTGVDEIILATGYMRYNPWLYKALRDVPGNPPQDLKPPLTDIFGRRTFKNVHWTGNYIPDPTLALAIHDPWHNAKWQSYGYAKVWKGTARIPNEPELWRQYNSSRWNNFRGNVGTSPALAIERQYVTWLNNESLELGGKLVAPWPVADREKFAYFANLEWDEDYITAEDYAYFDELPAKDWPKCDGSKERGCTTWGEDWMN